MHTPNWLQRLIDSDDDLSGGDPSGQSGAPASPDDPRWDDGQREVIEAPVNDRLLVLAGPGAGKTDVACARVARLVEDGTPGDKILLVSFTNAAVEEIRDRIRALGETDPHQLASVHVRTIDSLAAVLRFNYREEEVEFSGYDENLEDFLELLQNPTPYLTDYLDSFRHVIVDEAQDVTGLRRRVLEELFDHLPDGCGITVFGDPCQSIYGWTSDASAREDDGDDRTLLDYLADDYRAGFRPVPLSGQYRTADEELKTLKADLRDVLEEDKDSPEDNYRSVRERLADYGSDERVRWKDIPDLLRGRDETMVLFRTTAALAMASSYLNSDGVDHRIRYSGMPRLVAPWVGYIFSDFLESDMTEDIFYERWEETPSHLRRHHEPEEAWRILRSLAGERSRTITPSLLRYRLAGRRPPDSLLGKELGTSGPLLSTIHAAKGREAPEVVLLLTGKRDSEETGDIEEEARVLYVGATRPRETLDVLDRPGPSFMPLDSGRICRYTRSKDRLQIFFGLNGDVDTGFSVSSRLENLETDAGEVQSRIAELNPLPQEVMAKRVNLGGDDWRYLIKDDDSILGSISRRADRDLWNAGRRFLNGKQPARKIIFLWFAEPSTCVLPEDDGRLDRMAEPYARTGFWLGPVIKGFPPIQYYGRKS